MRKGLFGVLVLFAMVAAACGGQLSEDEIRAELATDGGGSGFVGSRTGTGSGVALDETGAPVLDEFGEPVEVTLPDGSTAPGTDSSGSTPGASDGGGTEVGGGPVTGTPSAPSPNAAAPQGGNGGAVDVGVTATEIKIGNVATIGGPVPGLFKGALVGTQARFALANSEGGLFGRQFKVVSADDNFDAGQNRSKHKELVGDVFAFVGSFSLFDGASVSDLKSSGVVDVGRALSPERQAVSTHFSPNPVDIGWPTTGCNYLKEKFGDKVKKMAIFWGNQDAARDNAFWQREACESVGFEFIYEREFQATESNFTADIIQMQQRDVEGFFVTFDVSGIARFFKSLDQQGFDPPIKFPSAAAYDGDFIKLAGANAAEGTIIGQSFALYLGSDQAAVPEIARFREWMQRVDPGQKIDIFALYGWMSAELFLDRLEAAGPKAKRADVVKAMNATGAWDNRGITPAIDVPGKTTASCELYLEVKGGQFTRQSPAKGFNCNGTFHKYRGG